MRKWVLGNCRLKLMLGGETPGHKTEIFLQKVKRESIILYHLKRSASDMTFSVYQSDLESVFAICKKLRLQVVVLEKHGLPFLLQNMREKSSFYTGLILAMLVLILSSGKIWYFDTFGNEQIKMLEIASFLEQKGYRPGISQALINTAVLSVDLRAQFPELNWVSCYKNGTNLNIMLKENDGYRKESTEAIQELDFTAPFDGEIVRIVTKKGTPMVKSGEMVQKGQILISSEVPMHDINGELTENRIVNTQGEVLFKYQLHKTIYVPKDKKDSKPNDNASLRDMKALAVCFRKICENLADFDKKEVEIVGKNVTIKKNEFSWDVDLQFTILEGVKKYE